MNYYYYYYFLICLSLIIDILIAFLINKPYIYFIYFNLGI